jgi:alpha-L-arabinofuranosidase
MNRLILSQTFLICVLFAARAAAAAEFHVATTGNDGNAGSALAPFRTISAAAQRAQPGDIITVHAGVFRERVSPPRGGQSDAKRITYRAAPGDRVTLKGSEIAKGWSKVRGEVWKLTLPNTFFGGFNPYRDVIHGDWFDGKGRTHHTGAVYLNGDWLTEAVNLEEVMLPEGAGPDWLVPIVRGSLFNVAWFRPVSGGSVVRIPAARFAAQEGIQTASCTEGGDCVGWIDHGDWVRYDGVDFGERAERVEFRVASATVGGIIELRLDSPTGELLGTCAVEPTGDWQAWTSREARIKPTSGVKTLCLAFKSPPPDPRFASTLNPQLWFAQVDATNTAIWARFKGVDPNREMVEINVRPTVFTPEKTGIDYLTVRGFDLCHAAAPWAPPTAGQIGVISAYWCKGWIIEDNEISYSTCSGVALGKYGDEWDNRAESAEGYVGTLTRALTNGWNRATVGSHLVRNNRIHHCEQTGVVGSLGCSFSTVMGNEIHDIHTRQLFGGAEMAGIKFHGAIDVLISGNHIYRCGDVAGLWLDWMAQGAQVTGNLMHDNFGGCGDIFLEMQHGPILVANNLLLSAQKAFELNSQGVAFAHNLIAGAISSDRGDTRSTPYHPAHTTDLAGLYPAAQGDSGDHRFYNNLLIGRCSLQALDNATLACFAAGNVFTKGTQPSRFDTKALLKPEFDAGAMLRQKSDGWYLTFAADPSWRGAGQHQTVTTELLGKTVVSQCAFEHRDGSPLSLNTDYLGERRDQANPFPGPFETVRAGRLEIKVWPVKAPPNRSR